MNDENELLEPLATEAGQQEIARAIRDISSLENAVRAERAASLASVHAGQATQSALLASEAENKAKDWATKTDGYVEQETITIPPEQEGEEPTTETINLYSAKYYAALAQDIFNNMSFDSVPTENSNALLSSGTVYSALDLKADKSTTYTKTEVDTALSNVQSTLTFDNVPTANSDNPVKSSGIKTALDGKQDNLTFDSTPTANSTNPVTSGGIYTALLNVDANIEVDDEITEDSDNPVTSAAIYEALLNFTPSGGGDTYNGDVFVSGTYIDTNNLIDNLYDFPSSWISTTGNLVDYTATQDCYVCGFASSSNNNSFGMNNGSGIYINNVFVSSIQHTSSNHSAATPIYISLKKGDNFRIYNFNGSVKLDIKVYGVKHGDVVSEQMYSNVLYENSSGWSSGSITLSDDWNNYDFISVEVWDGDSRNGKNQSYYSKEFLESCYNNSKYIITVRYQGSQVYYKPTTNYKTFIIGGNGDGCKIYKIIGYKMAKGGYSGIVSDARMTVKSGEATYNQNISRNYDNHYVDVSFDSPMLDTNYVVFCMKSNAGAFGTYLNTNVGNKTVNGFTIFLRNVNPVGSEEIVAPITVDWIAIRPNSYTREGMVEDVLFSNASGVDSGTINLSGNISDYDLIDIQVIDGTSEYHHHPYSSSTLLEYTDKRLLIDGYADHYIDFYVSDSSLTYSGNGRDMKVTKITGIKFGRYVSGVAVDTTVTQNSNAVVTSGAVYDALQNYTPSGGGSGGSSGDIYNGDVYILGTYIDTDNLIDNVYNNYSTWRSDNITYTATLNCYVSGCLAYGYGDGTPSANVGYDILINDVFIQKIYSNLTDCSVTFPILVHLLTGDVLKILRKGSGNLKGYLNSYGEKYNDTVLLRILSTVDSTITSNSLNPVESSGIYSTLSNILSRNTLYATLIDDGEYYCYNSDTILYTNNSDKVYKKYNGAAICALANYMGYRNIMLISPTENGAVLYKHNNSTSDVYNGTFTDSNGIIWYYYGAGYGNLNSGTCPFPRLNNDADISGLTLEQRLQAIIDEAHNAIIVPSYSVAIDSVPTQNSNNLISSGAVYTALLNAGSSITVDSSITQNSTNPVESAAIYTALAGKENTLTFDTAPTNNSTNPVTSGGVYTALASKGDVTTNTDQNITGTKTFVGSKKVGFKQSTANDKLGFTLYGNTGTERGYLEFNPTNTIDGVAGLMTLGNYATSAGALTHVGFRRYSNISGANGAYNLLTPLIADAKTPFSLTTTYTNFYLPLGFTDGTTTVKTAKSGLVDLSPLLASLEARIAALEGN